MKKDHTERGQDQASQSSSVKLPDSGTVAASGIPLISLYSVPPIPASGMASKHRILVVDKEAILAALITASCDIWGWKVITATSVDEALALAQQHHFDLVITDYQLPPDNGLLLISKLRQLELKMSAIIMVDEPKIAEFVQPTFLDIAKVLIKPLTAAGLKSAIDEIMRR